MVVNISMTVDGALYSDIRNLRVTRNTDEYNSSSTFEANLDSPFGRHSEDFIVGKEVIIKANKDADPTDNLFVGVLESIKFEGAENTQTLTLSGKDYSIRLIDSTVEPIVYKDSEVSTIVIDIINNNVEGISTANVDVTDTIIPRISFNHESVFDALQALATQSGFFFYVDNNKVLNFKRQMTDNSGLTFDNTNVTSMNFDTTREQMTNKVWVYGGRYLTGFKEIIRVGSPFDGTSPGSVFTLLSKPHNTQIESSRSPGSTLKGGIFEFSNATSGPEFLVNFDDRQVIFVSGTALGYNSIPASGGSFIANYDRETPIAKTGQNRDSITAFGIKTLKIQDDTIRDPRQAVKILQQQLENSNPFKRIEAEIKGWYNITMGQTATLVMENFGLNMTAKMISVDYNFDKSRMQSEKILSIRFEKKVTDITDTLIDFQNRIDALESDSIQEGDLITRLEDSIGSVMVVGSEYLLYSRDVKDSFLVGTDLRGRLGLFGSPIFGNHVSGPVYISGIIGRGNDKALEFNGTTSYIEFGPQTFASGKSALSFAYWIKPATPFTSLPGVIMYGNVIGGPFLHLGIAGQSYIRTILNTNSGLNNLILDTNNLTSGVWQHVAFTWDGINGRTYINGVAGPSGATTGSILANQNGSFTIGAIPGVGYLLASMDEIKIYDKSLSSSEVGSLVEKKNYPPTNLMAAFTFDEGIGSRVLNDSFGGSFSLHTYLGDRRGDQILIRSGGFDYSSL